MRKGQASQSRVRYKRAVGYFVSPYRKQQTGGDIVGLDPWTIRRLSHITYPWQLKGRKKSIKTRRKR